MKHIIVFLIFLFCSSVFAQNTDKNSTNISEGQIQYNVYETTLQGLRVIIVGSSASDSTLLAKLDSLITVMNDTTITVEISGNTGSDLNVADDSTHTNLLLLEATLTNIETAVEIMDGPVDTDLNAQRVVILNPPSARYAYGTNSATNLDTDSLFTILPMAGYKYASFHLKGSGGVTFTIFGTNIAAADNGDSDDGNWINLSPLIMGATSVTDVDTLYFVDTPFALKTFMVRAVTSDATNATNMDLTEAN